MIVCTWWGRGVIAVDRGWGQVMNVVDMWWGRVVIVVGILCMHYTHKIRLLPSNCYCCLG